MSDVRDPATDQRLPRPGKTDIHEYVIARLGGYGLDTQVQAEMARLLQARLALGVSKYGRPLQSHNGRDALEDALDEILDALVYLQQMALEGEWGMEPLIDWTVRTAASLAARRLLRK